MFLSFYEILLTRFEHNNDLFGTGPQVIHGDPVFHGSRFTREELSVNPHPKLNQRATRHAITRYRTIDQVSHSIQQHNFSSRIKHFFPLCFRKVSELLRDFAYQFRTQRWFFHYGAAGDPVLRGTPFTREKFTANPHPSLTHHTTKHPITQYRRSDQASNSLKETMTSYLEFDLFSFCVSGMFLSLYGLFLTSSEHNDVFSTTGPQVIQFSMGLDLPGKTSLQSPIRVLLTTPPSSQEHKIGQSVKFRILWKGTITFYLKFNCFSGTEPHVI